MPKIKSWPRLPEPKEKDLHFLCLAWTQKGLNLGHVLNWYCYNKKLSKFSPYLLHSADGSIKSLNLGDVLNWYCFNKKELNLVGTVAQLWKKYKYYEENKFLSVSSTDSPITKRLRFGHVFTALLFQIISIFSPYLLQSKDNPTRITRNT